MTSIFSKPNGLRSIFRAIPTFVLVLAASGCSHAALKSGTLNAGKEIPLNPHLKMVHFALNESNLTQESKLILNEDAEILKRDSSLKFQIQGYCDERGTDEYNLALGKKRANAVMKYLESKGIEPERISILSFGKSDPIDPGKNEAAYSMNRRASFVIESFGTNASL